MLQPGLGTIVPQLAGRAGVTRANGYLQAATWGGFTVGPLLAGVLTAAGGTGLALGAVAVVYGLGAIGLRLLPLAAGPAGLAGRAAPADTPGEPVGRQLSAGLRFLRADREAGLLVLVVAVMVAFGNMASVAEVAFAEGVLRAGASGYSVLVAAWTAGMLGGTLLGGLRAPPPPGRWPPWPARSSRAPGSRWPAAPSRSGRPRPATGSAAWPTASRSWRPAVS